jgi:UDP-glucose 4-epimerase
MVKCLNIAGHHVTVFDNLSTGHRAAVRGAELVEGDVLDRDALERLFANRHIDAVMHFAAVSLVGESVRDPYLYYRNNVVGSLNLLEAMTRAGVNGLVFSSTAAVYGLPEQSPIFETQRLEPINPYGASKVMVERLLKDAAVAYGLRSATLRYFNAAGADPSGEIGESHTPETHLIPNVLKAALGDSTVSIFGSDYATRDGTCVRDYVHVDDLARAHLLALDYIQTNEGAHYFNLGNGKGFSVLEIIEAARRVTGKQIICQTLPRRAGDPPVLVASNEKARHLLGWNPTFDSMDMIIETAWRWHRNSCY